LKDMAALQNGYAFKSENFANNPTMSIVLTPGNVHIGGGYQEGKGRYFDESIEIPNQFVLSPEDIFVMMTDLTPSAQTLGYPAKIPDDGKTYLLNQRLAKVTSVLIDNDFLFYSLTTDGYHNEIVAGASGTTVRHTSPSKILSFCLPHPTYEAQVAIGSFFRNLDDTITLKKQQHQQTANIKKAMLEKMFPKKGATVPEVRFENFTGEWVKADLLDVLVPSVGNNTLSRAELNYDGGEVMNIHYGDILIKFGSFVDVANVVIPYITNGILMDYKNNLLRNGDVIFADTAEDETAGKVVEITNSSGIDVVSGLHTMVYRPKLKFATYFLAYYLNSNSYRHQILPLLQGAKVLSISRSNLAKTRLCYPESFEEQSAIGNFFRNLEALITAQQEEFEKLQNIKKSLLSKMFV